MASKKWLKKCPYPSSFILEVRIHVFWEEWKVSPKKRWIFSLTVWGQNWNKLTSTHRKCSTQMKWASLLSSKVVSMKRKTIFKPDISRKRFNDDSCHLYKC
jgi:hypothetical protein